MVAEAGAGGSMTESAPPPDPRVEGYDKVDYSMRLYRDGKGRLVSCLQNVFVVLSLDEAWRGVIAYDEFAYRTVKLKPPPYEGGATGTWTDIDDSFAAVWLAEVKKIDVTSSLVAEAVQMVASRNAVHPVRDWLMTLKWDEQPRLHDWLQHYLGAGRYLHDELRPHAGQYFSVVGTKWLVSAVARIFEPGCQVDHAIILEGVQGLGKSTVLRDLFGADWFADTPVVIGDKDSYQVLRGKWGIEIAELDSFNKAETTRVKAYISGRVDTYRESYGRRSEDHARQCVFAGTTNQDEYFRDSTGNRRFWPLTAAHYLRAQMLQDREQLWAEAVAIYRRWQHWRATEGTAQPQAEPPPAWTWWPSREESALIEQHCAFREIQDPWLEVIAAWLENDCIAGERAGTGGDRITTARILGGALKVDKSRMDERAMATRVGRCMRQLGYVKREAEGRKARQVSRYYYMNPKEPPPKYADVPDLPEQAD